jgi:N utilization substance protein B
MAAETQRRRARELALKAIYAQAVSDLDTSDVSEGVIQDESVSARNLDYARALFGNALEHRDWAEEIISQLAEHWHLQRIARIDRSILILALVELKTMPDVPEKVVINEAIELAKKYSSADSAGFVNGILDRFVKGAPERPAE